MVGAEQLGEGQARREKSGKERGGGQRKCTG